MKKVLNIFLIGLAVLFLISFIGFSLTGNSIFDIFLGSEESGDVDEDVYLDSDSDLIVENMQEVEETYLEYYGDKIIPPEERKEGIIPPLNGLGMFSSDLDRVGVDANDNKIPSYIFPDGEYIMEVPVIVSSEQSITGNVIVGNYFDAPCSATFTQNLNPSELVEYIKQKNQKCLDEFIWDYNPQLVKTMSNDNLLVVLDTLNSEALGYGGKNGDYLLNLLYFVRVAHYWEFYYPKVLIFDNSFYAGTRKSLESISKNKHLFDYSPETINLLASFIVTADSAEELYSYLPIVEKTLEDFNKDPMAKNDWWRGMTVYYSFYGLSRIGVSFMVYPNAKSVYLNLFSGKTIELIKSVALNKNFIPDQTWIVDNAIWSLSHVFEHIPEYNGQASGAIEDILNSYAYLSEPYLWAINVITWYNNCLYGPDLSNQKKLCMSELKPRMFKLALPNTFTFEDGAIIFKTKLGKDEIERLYTALKDVDQQTFRLFQSNVPVDGDPNGVITMVIYASPEDYGLYQPFLYGLGTNNGGIYIESWGTLFTYDRLSSQSYYTIEELLRHEYAHYLQGRYMVKGSWGSVPFYDHGRLTWFEEGSAEFLVASSSDNILDAREKLVRIARDYRNNNYYIPDVSEIVYATYSSPTSYYYTFGSILFNFLYDKKRDTFFELLNYVRSDDIVGFDNLIKLMSLDKNLNLEFHKYIDDEINILNTLKNPDTKFVDVRDLELADVNEVQKLLMDTKYIPNLKCHLSSSFGLPRYTCSGTLTGYLKPSWTMTDAWTQLNSYLENDYYLIQNNGINNFNEFNCRIGEITFIDYYGKGFYPLANFNCEGPLGVTAEKLDRTPQGVLQYIKDFDYFGIVSSCSLLSSDVVVCSGSADSGASYSTSSEADNKVTKMIEQLRRDVFSSNPQFYRSFRVERDGNPIINQENGKYRSTQKVKITVDFSS